MGTGRVSGMIRLKTSTVQVRKLGPEKGLVQVRDLGCEVGAKTIFKMASRNPRKTVRSILVRFNLVNMYELPGQFSVLNSGSLNKNNQKVSILLIFVNCKRDRLPVLGHL